MLFIFCWGPTDPDRKKSEGVAFAGLPLGRNSVSHKVLPPEMLHIVLFGLFRRPESTRSVTYSTIWVLLEARKHPKCYV